MMTFVRVCLPFVLLCCTSSAWSQVESLTVQTYNIRYLNQRDGQDVWDNRSQTVIASIQDADVIGLQEVVAAQLEDIRRGTSDYQWYGAGRDDGKLKGEATPIGWRKSRFELLEKGTFWLSPTPQEVGSKGWDAALPRVASWVRLRDLKTKSEFLFLNTHFDHRGQQARAESATLIRQKARELANGLPVVITGDLNAKLKSQPLVNLLGEAVASSADDEQAGWRLLNARDEAPTKDPGPDSTWNGFKEIVSGQRIDFVLTSQNVEVVRFETMNPKTDAGRFASDHLPLLVEIRFAEAD